MKNKLETDAALRKMTDSIPAARQNAAQAFEAMLAEKARVILGAVPYDSPGWEQRHPTESLCDGLLADPSGKNRDTYLAAMRMNAGAERLDRIFTHSRLTPEDRTVMVRRYIDRIEDSSVISEMDGYANADTLLETALAKICYMMEKEAETMLQQRAG